MKLIKSELYWIVLKLSDNSELFSEYERQYCYNRRREEVKTIFENIKTKARLLSDNLRRTSDR